MLQVLIVLQELLAAVRVNLIAFASAATLATGIRIQSSVHASAEHGCAFYGAGLAAAAYLLVSHAARESKGEFQVQASQYDSPGLSCPRVPRSRPRRKR